MSLLSPYSKGLFSLNKGSKDEPRIILTTGGTDSVEIRLTMAYNTDTSVSAVLDKFNHTVNRKWVGASHRFELTDVNGTVTEADWLIVKDLPIRNYSQLKFIPLPTVNAAPKEGQRWVSDAYNSLLDFIVTNCEDEKEVNAQLKSLSNIFNMLLRLSPAKTKDGELVPNIPLKVIFNTFINLTHETINTRGMDHDFPVVQYRAQSTGRATLDGKSVPDTHSSITPVEPNSPEETKGEPELSENDRPKSSLSSD